MPHSSGEPKRPSRGQQDGAELLGGDPGEPGHVSDDARLAAQAYDEFPYEGYPFPLTHPERLATVATLFGMRPPPAATARVLELGCGTGGNLIPMAYAMPGASFAGFDLSGVQVERARATIAALGLSNISVAQRNILDVGDPGKFDYIICHGVYSWVPEDVQERILAICRELLSENGVALVSYNTFPGWHMRGSVREMMRYHVRQFDNAKMRVTQARALLDFLVKSVDSEKSPYGMHLAGELKLLSSCDDYYIAHEHLERWNTPVYFYEFAERLARHELQYLGESEFSTMVVKNLAAPVAETLSRSIRDVLQMEQYMDFIRNRMFRSTLLCHRARQLDRNVNGDRVQQLFVAANAQPAEPGADLVPGRQESFRAHNGMQFHTSDTVTRAAVRVLASAWPRAIPFQELVAEAAKRAGAADSPGAPPLQARLGADFIQLYAANAIEFHSMPSPFTNLVTERPRASAVARLQAKQGPRITNLRHESLRVNDVERTLVGLLDGASDRAQVIEGLVRALATGELNLRRDGQPITDRADQLEQLGRFYDQVLPQLAVKALLAA